MGGFATKPKNSKPKVFAPPPPRLRPPQRLPPPPRNPQTIHPKGSFRSRARILVPLVLTLNFGIGAYVLVKTASRDKMISEEEERTSSTSTA